MAMPPIDDMDTAAAVAKVRYDTYEWSGCDGARWERVPAEAQRRVVREAAEWIACVREAQVSSDFQIGDGVGLASDAAPEASGTVVDFVYIATAPADERSQVRVYWRTSGGASDHRPQDLTRLT